MHVLHGRDGLANPLGQGDAHDPEDQLHDGQHDDDEGAEAERGAKGFEAGTKEQPHKLVTSAS